MARAIACAFLWCGALIFIGLMLAGCAKPDPYDWGALARGVQKQQGN